MSIIEISLMDDEIAALDHTTRGFREAYARVSNFVHYEIENTQMRSELIQYADKIGFGYNARSIPLDFIGIEGKIAYCLNRGAKLAPSSIERINKMLTVPYQKYQNDEQTPAVEWEIIPENYKTKITRAYVTCYSLIDNAKARVLAGKMDSREFGSEVRRIIKDNGLDKSAIDKMLLEHYTELLADAKLDESTASWIKPLSTIVDVLLMQTSNRDSVRSGTKGAKARKLNGSAASRDRKGEKAAAKVTYKDEDTDLGVRSIDPTLLVGANAAVVFNTKNKHIEVYVATAGKTLSMHGAKITNFDTTVSVGKTLRKPEHDLQFWIRATSLRRLQVLAGGISGKSWEPTGKLNRNTLLIKIV